MFDCTQITASSDLTEVQTSGKQDPTYTYVEQSPFLLFENVF